MRHALWYVGVVFILTYVLDAVVFMQGGLQNPQLFAVLVGLQMLIPAAVAIVFRKWVSKEGFRGSGLGLGRKRYYVIGAALILGWLAASYLLSAATPWLQLDTQFHKAQAFLDMIAEKTGKPVEIAMPAFLVGMFVQTAIVGALLGLPAYFGEEYGWRAYLLPKLMELGTAKAIVLHGVVWGLWHAPIIAMGHNYPGYPVAGIFWMTAFCVLMGAVLAWLFYASGSVWVVSVAHGLINQGNAYVATFLVASVNPLLAGPVGLVGLALLAVIVAVLVVRRRFDGVVPAALV